MTVNNSLSLTAAQYELLSSLNTNYFTGLNPPPPSSPTDGSSQFYHRDDANRLTPPIDLPQWACVLLPCLTKLPAMQQFQLVKPYDAEILKERGTWQCYDSTCVQVGDIVRVTSGDIVPADVVLLSLGMEHYCSSSTTTTTDGANETIMPSSTPIEEEDIKELELVVDSKYVTGRERPTSYSIHEESKRIQIDHEEGKVDEQEELETNQELYCGSQILQGSAIAVVTQIGDDTKLATLIREGQWPLPKVRGVEKDGTYSLVASSDV